MRRRFGFKASFLTALAVIALALGAGPRGGERPVEHPIVLFTLEGLRPDVVAGLGGEPGWTPNFDRFLRSADWAGRAVAPSSALIPSTVSLLTGLRPWQHQVIAPGEKVLDLSLFTLGERLSDLGYQARGYTDSTDLAAGFGFSRGLRSFTALRRGARAASDLASLGSRKQFVWIHLPAPAPPYLRKPWMVKRLGTSGPELPQRVDAGDFEPYLDPAVPLPAARREELWAMYRLNVVNADTLLGRLLSALDSRPDGQQAIVAVTSLYGQEFREQGQIGAGLGLGRSEIEVPLAIRLPRGFSRRLAPPPTERVELLRLSSTLLEAAGGEAPPALPPSLFHRGSTPLLSELYQVAGANEFSLVEGDLQLRWRARFADAESLYFKLRRESLGQERESPARQSLRALVGRLNSLFRRSLPLSGAIGPPQLSLERWLAQGTERVEDPDQARAMAERLRLAWGRSVGAERPREQEERERR